MSSQKSEPVIIGVMGPGGASAELERIAYELGQRLAAEGWITLSGGRSSGVMDAVSRGARDAGGLTVGILPGGTRHGMSPAIAVPILTDMGNARNSINVLTSDVVVACGMGPGTASEVALAVKCGKQVVLLAQDAESIAFFKRLAPAQVHIADSTAHALSLVRRILEGRRHE